MEFEVSELREQSQKIQAALAQAQTNTNQVKTNVGLLQEDMSQVKIDVRTIDGRLDRGFGTNYEAKVAQNVRSILGQQVSVRNSKVLKGPSLRTDPDFDRQVGSTEASGVITEHESDELLLLDLIVSGTRTGTHE